MNKLQEKMINIGNVPDINLKDYHYKLPQERIAYYPSGKRDESRLIFSDVAKGNIGHGKFSDISSLIPENSLLVVNSTKVISARIKAQKPTGGKAEILCVDPVFPSADPQITMQAKGECSWNCIIGGRKICDGMKLLPEYPDSSIQFSAEITTKDKNEALVKFSWADKSISFAEVLEKIGKIPLPPYIKRKAEENDKDRYQTVYANTDGSVAAPTAGLHFTNDILEKLNKKGINKRELILHVGPGTFKPVDADDISGHEMHTEQVFVDKALIREIISTRESGNKIVATGTTSVRTLESLYWFGLKLIKGDKEYQQLELTQWEPYNSMAEGSLPGLRESLDAIISWCDNQQTEVISGYTSLFIMPGYDFKIIDGMITNFHLPGSTLILLVAAFLGRALWKRIYDEALQQNYRFLSYGDANFYLK